MAPRETENNAYAKFRGDEQRTLWYVMVFSGAVNCLAISAWALRVQGCKVFYLTHRPHLTIKRVPKS